jgi:hypothetical protein
MRRIAVFGSAAAALLIMVAVLGAGGASATAFCEKNESPCSGLYTDGMSLTLPLQLKEGTTSLFKTSGFETKCTGSTMQASLTKETSTEITGQVSGATFTGCSNSCTLTAQSQPYNARAVTTEAGDGTMTLSSGGSGTPRVLAKCSSFGVECTYGAKEPALKIDGGEPPLIVANSVSLAKESGGFLCSSTATWSAEYGISNFESLFLVQNGQPTMLCEEAPEEKVNGEEKYLECKNGKRYAGKVSGALGMGTTALFESKQGIGNITCGESTVAGRFDSNGLAVAQEGFTGWTFNTGKGACSSQLGKQPPVTIDVVSLPYKKSRFNYLRVIPAEGQVTAQGAFGLQPWVSLKYEGITCEYTTLKVVNSSFYNATALPKVSSLWSLAIEWKKLNGPAQCQTDLFLREVLVMSKDGGGNLYLAEK